MSHCKEAILKLRKTMCLPASMEAMLDAAVAAEEYSPNLAEVEKLYAQLAHREEMLVKAAEGWQVKIFTKGQVVDDSVEGMAFTVLGGTLVVLNTKADIAEVGRLPCTCKG